MLGGRTLENDEHSLEVLHAHPGASALAGLVPADDVGAPHVVADQLADGLLVVEAPPLALGADEVERDVLEPQRRPLRVRHEQAP